MWIAHVKLCEKLARAMLKGYWLGIEEERKRGIKRREDRLLALIFKRKGALRRKTTAKP
jgi:hypothetical protein